MSAYVDRPRQNPNRTHCVNDPSEEVCRDSDDVCNNVPADFTLAQGVALVMSQLTPEDVAYAKKQATETGCSPFSALHDRMDANMLLPFRGGFLDSSDQQETDYLNAVMEGVNARIAAI